MTWCWFNYLFKLTHYQTGEALSASVIYILDHAEKT